MKLYDNEMKEFLKEFQDELIEKDIPLWGKCTKDVGDNEKFYARCECGYESKKLYDTIDEAVDCESDTCPDCEDFLDFLPESYKYDEDDNTFTKLSEYEFVFKDDEVRLFELDADYNVIEYIDVYEHFDSEKEIYSTNIICYTNSENGDSFKSEEVYAKIIKTKAFAKIPEVSNPINEFEFNKLSLIDKIKKLEEQSNIIVDTDGSVITLDSEGKPTITFEAFDETYEIKNITIDNGIVILEYDEGFEVRLLLK